jgi:hypothetical protein
MGRALEPPVELGKGHSPRAAMVPNQVQSGSIAPTTKQTVGRGKLPALRIKDEPLGSGFCCGIIEPTRVRSYASPRALGRSTPLCRGTVIRRTRCNAPRHFNRKHPVVASRTAVPVRRSKIVRNYSRTPFNTPRSKCSAACYPEDDERAAATGAMVIWRQSDACGGTQ